jgi:protein-S-isoprenylcysteine O-methyltransferase Ste14
MLTTLIWVVVVAFPVSEILLAVFKRAKADAATVEDRGSLRLLWIVISVSVAAATVLQGVRVGHFHIPATLLQWLGLSLILAGLGVRWVSILTLGRLFTVNVAIHTDHALVEKGLYRHIRHPSYAGLLLAFLGLGVFFASWLSILALVVPIALAILNRIRREEAALLAAFGDSYAIYCRRTKRILPGLL